MSISSFINNVGMNYESKGIFRGELWHDGEELPSENQFGNLEFINFCS
jgi:hypothetical protein